jgi:hypothetical protein
MCYTTKCDTVEDDLMEHASEGNPGGKEANPMLSCNPGNVKRYEQLGGEGRREEKCRERTDDANIGLLEAWVSSGKVNSVSDKAHQVTRVSQTCSSYPKLSGSSQGYLKVTLA